MSLSDICDRLLTGLGSEYTACISRIVNGKVLFFSLLAGSFTNRKLKSLHFAKLNMSLAQIRFHC